ncbi:hypothetical protein AB205_0129090 [Aquarana catesbeiana]|uniref:Uncharacterized protein n=1 Tax=Aquarana catesbeiana TaxID=8400 RepID=A0A2G9RXI7_AQUCT|nr:hypothetical protein AB205_0129090 [Aquarana catesbeiana]
MTKRCIFSVDTVCSPCGPNEYMSVWNDDLKCALHMEKPCRCFTMGTALILENVYALTDTIFIAMKKYAWKIQTVLLALEYRPQFSGIKILYAYNAKRDIFPTLPQQQSNAIRGQTAEMIILISVLIVTLAVLLLICIWCYMTKYNTLKAPQDWMRETCDKLSGSEKKSQYREAKTTEPIYTIIKNTNIVENFHSGNLKEIETPRGRLIPMEDEYLDQRRSPEPENGSIVAGMESLSDLESGSLGTSHAYSDTSSDRLLFPNEEVTFPPCPEHHCSQSAKEAPRNRTEDYCIPDPVDKNYGQHSSRHEFHIYPQPYYHMPEKNTDKEPCSCFTNAQYTRSSSKNSTDNMSSPGTPPTPSGSEGKPMTAIKSQQKI